jgi:hypothetical protein
VARGALLFAIVISLVAKQLNWKRSETRTGKLN